jgi:DNA-binding FrmR family transcriptional regulator
MHTCTVYPPGVYCTSMQKTINRLKRLEGQLTRVREEIAAGTPCATVIPQLLAVKGALTATAHEYVADSLARCTTETSVAELSVLLKTIIKKL